MSSLAMRRVADQMLADATRAKNKTKPADLSELSFSSMVKSQRMCGGG